MIIDDKKTNLIRKLLTQNKSLLYIKERFSEEFNETIELIHIYNEMRCIAMEYYLSKKESISPNHKLFPELRFILRSTPFSKIINLKKSEKWKVILNERNKFLLYYQENYIGETDFNTVKSDETIRDFELKEEFLFILTNSSMFVIYLPSFKIFDIIQFGTDTPLRIDNDFIFFSDFKQKYIFDPFYGIQLSFAEKSTNLQVSYEINKKAIETKKTPKLLQKEKSKKEIKRIEIVYLIRGENKIEHLTCFPNKKVDGQVVKTTKKTDIISNINRIRIAYINDELKIITLKSPTENLLDSAKKPLEYPINFEDINLFKSHPEMIISNNRKLRFIYKEGSTIVYTQNKYPPKLRIPYRRFLSVHEIDDTFYIMTLTDDYSGFSIFEWDEKNDPSLIYEIRDIIKGSFVISADLYVVLEDDAEKSTQSFTQDIVPSENEIYQRHTEVERLRILKDKILVASSDKVLRAWTIDGEFLGEIAQLKDFEELKDFITLSPAIQGYVLDNTLIFIGSNWISGSKGLGEHINACLGGIPESIHKEQLLKLYSIPLVEFFNTYCNDISGEVNR